MLVGGGTGNSKGIATMVTFTRESAVLTMLDCAILGGTVLNRQTGFAYAVAFNGGSRIDYKNFSIPADYTAANFSFAQNC